MVTKKQLTDHAVSHSI